MERGDQPEVAAAGAVAGGGGPAGTKARNGVQQLTSSTAADACGAATPKPGAMDGVESGGGDGGGGGGGDGSGGRDAASYLEQVRILWTRAVKVRRWAGRLA